MPYFYKGFKSNLVDFLSLFSEFNKKFLFNAYPKPSTDNTINRFKGKFITLIFERLENAASINTDVRFTVVENEQIDKFIEVLSLQLSEKLPGVESALARLRRFVKSGQILLRILRQKKRIKSHQTKWLQMHQSLLAKFLLRKFL